MQAPVSMLLALLAGSLVAAGGAVLPVRAQVSYPAGPGGAVPLMVPALPLAPGEPGVAPAGTAANPLHVIGGGSGGAGGSVTQGTSPWVVSPAGSTVTNASATLAAANTAQQVLAASGPSTPRRIDCQNVSGAPLGLSLVSTSPIIGAPGTVTLPAQASWTPPGGAPVTNALWFIGGTAGQALTCWVYP